MYVCTGGDLGGNGGRYPGKNLRWGTAHASIPPIFPEELLFDVRQSTNWLKKGLKEEFIVVKKRFLVQKRVIYVIYQMSDSWDRQKRQTDKIESMT